MQVMTIKLDDQLDQLLKKNLKPYYSTKTEFVREAIRDKLKEIESQKNIAFLKSLQGKSKGTYLTKEDRQKIGEEFLTEKDQLEIFRKFNLE